MAVVTWVNVNVTQVGKELHVQNLAPKFPVQITAVEMETVAEACANVRKNTLGMTVRSKAKCDFQRK